MNSAPICAICGEPTRPPNALAFWTGPGNDPVWTHDGACAALHVQRHPPDVEPQDRNRAAELLARARTAGRLREPFTPGRGKVA